MSSWHVFILAYFGIYLVMVPFRQVISFWGFLLRDWLARLVISIFIVFVYSLFQEEPLAMNEVLPEQEEVPVLDLSDIMVDDMKEMEVQMEAVYILPSE